MSQSEQFVLAPASIPQEHFLASTSNITLYSGSAGAGKTFAIILNLVKFALKKNSTIVCFRRTSTELRSGGGIWQEASLVFHKMFGKNVKIRDRDMEIQIPSTNSVIKFSHLQHQSDVIRHLSAQYSVIIFDEATTFEFDSMILPLIGRLRNANVDYEPQMLWCTNPMYDHGIYHWIKDYYLDQYGIPKAETSNHERYFVMENGKPVWFNERKDAEEIYGSGTDSGIRSFRSIRAHVTDNRPLLLANPSYLSNLKALPPIKQRIFLDGSWTAREEEAGLFLRSFVTMVDYPNLSARRRVRAYDLASSPPSSGNLNPDWTRGVLMSKDDRSNYTIEDVVSIRDRPHVVEQLIFDTARRDGPGVTVVLPVDPGQAGVARAQDLKRKLAEMGIHCRLVRPNKSKRTRFLPFSALAEGGFVRVVRASWNDELFDELEEFSGLKPKERDDLVDSVSDCVFALNQGLELPSMDLGAIGNFTAASPLGEIASSGLGFAPTANF
jgi:predicted phage terminase large subunit-like protein